LADAEHHRRPALSLEPDRTGNIFAPQSNELHRFLGEFLARHGDIDGAELEFEKSSNGPPDENELHPPRPPLAYNHDGISLYDRGVRDAKAGRTGDAIGEITKGLELMKRLPVPDYGHLARRYIKLAELYDSQGNQEQVEAVLKEVDSMPEGELAVGLARARIRLNHSDQRGAERILRELCDRYSTNDDAWLDLANVEFDLKHYEQALISYRRAGQGWYGGAQLHLSMAQSLQAMGRDREALDQCRLADALGPRDFAIRFACAKLRSDIGNK